MSTNARIYLDFNATAPLVAAARSAMVRALDVLGNPSSVHAEGRAARDLVETARNQVAALAGRPREEVIFTSGGTEANGLGISRLAAEVEQRGLPRVVATTAREHPSLRGAVDALRARGWEVRHVIDWTDEPAHGAGLLAIGASNHELGTTVDLTGATSTHARLVHVDAVQLAGKRSLAAIPAGASVAISAHKIGGPQGVGALITGIDGGDDLDAGHQERGRRAGTENTVGIVGFGAAAAAIDLTTWDRVVELGARFEAGLIALGARINAAGWPKIGGTANAAFPGARGESIVIALDLAGISVSTGAACTSGSIKPSPVLLAIGQSPEEAREAVRFSLGRTTTLEEIERVLAVLPEIVARARPSTPVGPR